MRLDAGEKLRVAQGEVVRGVSVPPLQYSPGQRRKNNPIQARLLMAYCLVMILWKELYRTCRILMGMVRTIRSRVLFLVGSELLYQMKVDFSQASYAVDR